MWMQSVQGVQVTTSVHAVTSTDQVFDPTFVPAEANSMQEPLEVGQFFSRNAVQWQKMKLAVQTVRESCWLPEETI